MTSRLKQIFIFGGLGVAAALLARRVALLLSVGWSAIEAPGGMLMSALDFITAAGLLLITLPLRRGKLPNLKTTIFALAVAVIHLFWSLDVFAELGLWDSISGSALGLLATIVLLGELRLIHSALNEPDEKDDENDSDEVQVD